MLTANERLPIQQAARRRKPTRFADVLAQIYAYNGMLLDAIDDLGIRDNTLFIFYSDNGGNTHSNVPGSRGMNVKPGHP